jgi:hypothetical protein
MSDSTVGRESVVRQPRIGSRARAAVFGLFDILIRRPGLPVFALVAAFFSLGHPAGGVQRDDEMVIAGEIVAEKFELRSPAGKTAGLFHLTPAGTGALSLYDDKGCVRVEIGFDERGAAGVRLFGSDKRLRANLSVDNGTGAPRFELLDDHGNPGIKLEITKDFGPSIVVGTGRQGRVMLGVSKDGSPHVGLSDSKGPRIWMSASSEQAGIRLMGKRSILRSAWTVGEDGAASFSLFDRDQKERLVVSTDKDGIPAIRLKDPVESTTREFRVGGISTVRD